jgi:hypothetical protein
MKWSDYIDRRVEEEYYNYCSIIARRKRTAIRLCPAQQYDDLIGN